MRLVRAYLALGSNLGDRAAHLAHARARLGELPDTTLLGASRIEETEPLGGLPQPPYLNQMLAIDTALSPRKLLEAGHRIEAETGRVRRTRWEPRTLDVDLVQYGEVASDEPGLLLPHPGLAERDFWARGLEELHRQGL